MKTLKQIVLESNTVGSITDSSKITIYKNKNRNSGGSLAFSFTEKQTEKLISSLEKINDNYIQEFLMSVQSSKDTGGYSDMDVYVSVNGVDFVLYARWGDLRIGSSGGSDSLMMKILDGFNTKYNTSPSDDIVDAFSKSLETAVIK